MFIPRYQDEHCIDQVGKAQSSNTPRFLPCKNFKSSNEASLELE